MTKTNFLSRLAGALAAILLLVPPCARAEFYTFFLNSSQSYLDMSGNAFGLNFGPQSTGSMRAYVQGFIALHLTAGVLNFTNGGRIIALSNPAGPFSSAPNPGTGGLDHYGVVAGPTFIPGFGFVEYHGAYRSLELDITSGTAQNGVAPSGMRLVFTGGHLDWGAANSTTPSGPFTPFATGTDSMVGVSGTNTTSALADFDGYTLTLPVTFHTVGTNRYEDWTGQLVAKIGAPPDITTQPTNQTVLAGTSVTFGVESCIVCYGASQWRFNGTNIVGTYSPYPPAVYTIPSAQITNAGRYDVVITNWGGSITSAVATLTVLPVIDIGLRLFDGTATNGIACGATGPDGSLVSPLRIAKNGTNYSIGLVSTNAPDASKLQIMTASGVKALKKLP